MYGIVQTIGQVYREYHCSLCFFKKKGTETGACPAFAINQGETTESVMDLLKEIKL